MINIIIKIGIFTLLFIGVLFGGSQTTFAGEICGSDTYACGSFTCVGGGGIGGNQVCWQPTCTSYRRCPEGYFCAVVGTTCCPNGSTWDGTYCQFPACPAATGIIVSQPDGTVIPDTAITLNINSVTATVQDTCTSGQKFYLIKLHSPRFDPYNPDSNLIKSTGWQTSPSTVFDLGNEKIEFDIAYVVAAPGQSVPYKQFRFFRYNSTLSVSNIVPNSDPNTASATLSVSMSAIPNWWATEVYVGSRKVLASRCAWGGCSLDTSFYWTDNGSSYTGPNFYATGRIVYTVNDLGRGRPYDWRLHIGTGWATGPPFATPPKFVDQGVALPRVYGPWIQTTGGDVHSNVRINTPGGP